MAKKHHKQKVQNKSRLPSARWIGLGVFLLALLVRGVYLYDSSDSPTFYTPIVDSQTYDGLARGLAEGLPMTNEFFWQPLFYPLFLAVVYGLSNFSILCVKIIQVVLGALTAVFSFRLSEKIFGRGVGLLAGVITAIYMPLVFFETELLAVGWAAFWMVAMVLALLKVKEKPKAFHCFIFGFLGALGIITRPVFLLFFVAACVWLIIVWIREHFKPTKLIRGLLGIAFGFLLVAGPVGILSHRVTDRASILPFSGGINFYIGNNPNYKKTITIRPGLGWRELTAIPARQGIVDDRGMEQFFFKKTMDYIIGEPVSFFKGLVYKTIQFFSSVEIPRNMDIYLFRRWSWLLGMLVWKIGRFGFPFGVLLPLAFLGLVFYWKKMPGPVLLSLFFYSVSVISVFVTSRYRVPVVPVMSVLAAAGLGEIRNIVQKQHWKRLAVACVIVLGIGMASSATGPFYEEKLNYEAELYYGLGSTYDRWGRVEEAKAVYLKAVELRADYAGAHYNLANILKSQSRLEEAINHYSQSLQTEPNSVEIINNFGVALQMQGKVDQAIQQWEKALELAPSDPYAHFNIGLVLAERGKLDQSIKHFNEALQAKSDWVELHINLGMILFQRGEVNEAIIHFIEALRIRPGDAEVHNSLGIALGSEGRLDEAVQHFRQAVKLEPGYPEAHYNLGYALELLGKFAEATVEYRQVLQIDPNHAESRRRLEVILTKQQPNR